MVSGLVLSFVPDAARAVAEFARVGDLVAAYVWDYAEGMQLMRHFWDAATDVDPRAAELDEGRTEPQICRPDALHALWEGAGLTDIEVREIVVPTVFASFADFWEPFLGGTGAAPAYVATLPPDQVDAIRERLRQRLPAQQIELTARAWAVRGGS